MQIHHDIPYVATPAPLQTLDLYVPDASPTAKYPLIVYIHGGAWRSGDKSELTTMAKGLVTTSDSKVAVAVINYQLSVRDDPTTKHPLHLNDTISAVNFLLTEQYTGSERIDTENVYLVGHSAGAQLAGAMTLRGHEGFKLGGRIRGVLGVGGIYDLQGLVDVYPSYSDFVDMAFDKDHFVAASPQQAADVKFEGAEHIKFMVVNSTTDELIASELAAQFAAQLVCAKYDDVALVVRDLGTHFGQLDDARFWRIVIEFVL